MKYQKPILALVTYLALVPLVYFIPPWVESVFQLGKLANVILSVAIIVPIISYGVMPLVMHWLSRLSDSAHQ